MKEPPKKQIALKSTNDKRSSNTNMNDEKLDDLALVKKWRKFQNNRQFQKKEDKSKEKNKKIICYDCDKLSHKRTECPNKKKFTKKKKYFKTHGMIVMKMILKKMKFKKRSPTCASWLLKMS
ncbi:Uncharacterized protein Adt_05584 [Abeliophyllum distichum]|uniref:CCHC-type domain-containing protein n=1 Tax=Abeliophyllum distichum TaxID=126358 RepID=A0ABD1V6N7_9LAMI